MSLVTHTINKNRYVYDHFRVNGKVKTVYLGRESDIVIHKGDIDNSGYPVNQPDYTESHKYADARELNQYGYNRWNVVENYARANKLIGTHIGDKIMVSSNIPDKYKGQVLYHERQEMKKMVNKR